MKLNKKAQDIVTAYSALAIGDKKVSCPYFNNKKTAKRGGLRVLIGKGSPKDIIDEIVLIALRKKINLNDLDKNQIREFLVKNNIGIDCSGFVFHVLNAQLDNTLPAKLQFKKTHNPLRFLLQKLRPVENTNVQILADDKNSHEVNINNSKPGDMIIMTGLKQAGSIRDHVLLITEINDKKITYTHSLQWKSDSDNEHGIKQGQITITNKSENLITQTWVESGKKDEDNETWQRASKSIYCKIRRLTCLDDK